MGLEKPSQKEYDLILIPPVNKYNGVALQTRKLYNFWTAGGKAVLIVSLRSYTLENPLDRLPDFIALTEQDEPIKHGLKKPLKTFLNQLFALRKIFKQHKNARVVALGGPANALSVMASLGLRPYIFTSSFSDPRYMPKERLWHKLLYKLDKRNHPHIVNAHASIKELQKTRPNRPYHLLPNFIDTSKGLCTNHNKQPILLALGRLEPLKGSHLILDAFSQMASKAPDWKLYIVGGGSEYERLLKQRDKLQLEDRVVITGHKDDAQPYLEMASIYIHFSKFEGVPTTLLEAMSFQNCCIVCDSSPGPLELIQHKQNGLITPYPDLSQLAASMKLLISDTPLRTRLTEHSKETVKEHDSKIILEQWNRVIWGDSPR